MLMNYRNMDQENVNPLGPASKENGGDKGSASSQAARLRKPRLKRGVYENWMEILENDFLGFSYCRFVWVFVLFGQEHRNGEMLMFHKKIQTKLKSRLSFGRRSRMLRSHHIPSS